MHNLKINIFPRLPFHPPITVPQRIKFVSETGSAGRESESERVWKSRVRSRDANASDGSFPLFAAHFCRRAPPSRFYRGPETVHRRCRRYAGRIELNGAKGGEAGYTCLENVSRRWLDHRATRRPPNPLSLPFLFHSDDSRKPKRRIREGMRREILRNDKFGRSYKNSLKGKKERKERYSLPDSFAVPAPFVRILLADRVGQGAVEGARPDHAGQEVAELHVQLGRQGPAGRSGSCVRLDRRRRLPGCIRDAPLARRRRLQLRAAAHLPHLKRDRR